MLHVVTDFDGTLMHQDVGNTLMRELGVLNEERMVEATRLAREKQIGSREWILEAYPYLASKREQVDGIIEGIYPREGALDFLDFCSRNEIPVTILSDGMSYYIERITKRYGINVRDIIVNPIRYTEDGGYQVDVQNRNEACSWCGCCKAGVVRSLKAAGAQVVYIGDGSSDLYGSGYADWVFARSSLAKHMSAAGDSFFPFESFHDVLDVLAPRLDSFRNGSAEGKRTVPNTFCTFTDE